MTQDDFEDFPLLTSVSFPVCVAASVLCPVWIATLFAVVFGPFELSLVLPFVTWTVLALLRFNEEEGKSSTQSRKSSSAYAMESCLLSLWMISYRLISNILSNQFNKYSMYY